MEYKVVEVPWVDGSTREVTTGTLLAVNEAEFVYAREGGYARHQESSGTVPWGNLKANRAFVFYTPKKTIKLPTEPGSVVLGGPNAKYFYFLMSDGTWTSISSYGIVAPSTEATVRECLEYGGVYVGCIWNMEEVSV